MGLFMKKWVLALLIGFFCATVIVALDASPITITFKTRVIHSDPAITYTGSYPVTVGLYKVNPSYKGHFVRSPDDYDIKEIWSEFHEEILFKEGGFSLVFGKKGEVPLHQEDFATENVHLGILIHSDTFFMPLSSIPFAIRTLKAETAYTAHADRLIPGSVFSSVTGNLGLHVKKQILIADKRVQSLAINKAVDSSYKMDVGGIVNANQILLEGVPIEDTFAWQRSKSVNNDIYTNYEKIGIGTQFPNYSLQVQGEINFDEILIDGKRLSAAEEWRGAVVDASNNLYFSNDNGSVGLGTVRPKEKLDVNGGVIVGKRHSSDIPTSSGTIVWNEADFSGFDGVTWHSLIGLQGNGDSGQIAAWNHKKGLDNLRRFVFDRSSNQLAIGTTVPRAKIYILGDEDENIVKLSSGNRSTLLIDSQGKVVLGEQYLTQYAFMGINGFTELIDENAQNTSLAVFNELKETGLLDADGFLSLDYIVGQSITPNLSETYDGYAVTLGRVLDGFYTGGFFSDVGYKNYKSSKDNVKLRVNMPVHATEFHIYGVPYHLSKAKGDRFKAINRDSIEDREFSIFYSKGNVSIGQPRTSSNFEIAAPNVEKTQYTSTSDPVITFTLEEDDISYTMGLDADDGGKFRVENSTTVGSKLPLFIIEKDRFGVGMDKANANLHVSGNTGLIVSGTFGNSESITLNADVPTFVFKGNRGATRIGMVESNSELLGRQWDNDAIGYYSIGIGKNSFATGNFSTVLSGENNQALHAYTTVVGGENNRASGVFSYAFGANTAANHDGSFVWSGTPLFLSPGQISDIFQTSKTNQFLIDASSGVGIGTAETANAALTVRAHALQKHSFMSLLPDPLDVTASAEIFQALVSDRYLNTEGYFDDFYPTFTARTKYHVFPVNFGITTSNIYTILANRYNDGVDNVLKPDEFKLEVSYIENATDYALWKLNLNRTLSVRAWETLVHAGYLGFDNTVLQDVSGIPSTTLDVDLDINEGAIWTALNAAFIAGDKVSPQAFVSNVKEAVNNLGTFTNWLSGEAATLASRGVFNHLKNSGVIDSSGNFVSFRPIFDFSQTEFNGQTVDVAAIFSVLTDHYYQNVFVGSGYNGVKPFTIESPGAFGIGYEDIISAKLAVSGSVGIGDTTPKGVLSIRNIATSNYVTFNALVSQQSGSGRFTEDEVSAVNSTGPYSFLVRNTNKGTTPSFVVNVDGMVGIGTYHDQLETDQFTISDNVKVLVEDGNVIADGFTFPSGEALSIKPPVIVWNFEETTPNIYYVSGNVGVGTVAPHSLLELSNLGGKRPEITFDLDGVDHYSVGLESETLIFGEGAITDSDDALVIASSNVGIHTQAPLYPLQINNSAIFTQISVSTSNHSVAFSTPYLRVADMSVAGEILLKWVVEENPDRIYTSSGKKVGIGLSRTPVTDLEVVGTVNVQNSVVVNGEFLAKQGILLDKMILTKSIFEAQLFVNDGNVVVSFLGKVLSVSDILTFGTGLTGKATVWNLENTTVLQLGGMLWLNNNINIGKSSFNWNSTLKKWEWNTAYQHKSPGDYTVSNNIDISQSTSVDSLRVGNSIKFGPNVEGALSKIDTTLTYEGNYFSDTKSFSANTVSLNMQSNLSDDSHDIQVLGAGVFLQTGTNALITQGGTAIGLSVDVSDINIQLAGSNTRGFKHAAYFQGDVGIGTAPRRELDLGPTVNILDVRGGVKATSFQITDRLSITTVNVGSDSFVVDAEGNVGVNTKTPQAKFEVNGTAKIDTLKVSGGIQSHTLSAYDQALVVNEDGFVGMGLTAPENVESLWGMKRVYGQNDGINFNSTVVSISLTEAIPNNVGAERYVTGLGISYTSDVNNVLGTVTGEGIATGLRVDMTSLKTVTGSRLVGMVVDVSTGNSAIFYGGKVGINAIPDTNFELTVGGTLRASNSDAMTFLTDPNGAIFSHLTLADGLVVGTPLNPGTATINRLYISGELTQKSLSLTGPFDLDITLAVDHNFLATDVSINGRVEVTNGGYVGTDIQSDVAAFNTLQIGAVKGGDAVVLRGGGSADKGVVLDQLVVTSLEASRLKVGAVVGIDATGANRKKLSLLIKEKELVQPFDVGNTDTWSSIKVQSLTDTLGISSGVNLSINDAHIGLLARRSTNLSPSASHLVFVLNEEEKMRIHDDGGVSIGTSNYIGALTVGSTGKFENGEITITKNIFTDSMEGIGDLSIDSSVLISPTLDVKQIGSSKSIVIKRGVVPFSNASYGGVYIEPVADHFGYITLLNGADVSGNLSLTFNVTANTVPYYNTGHQLSAPSLIQEWVAKESIDSFYHQSKVLVESEIGKDVSLGDFYDVYKTQLALDKRTTPQSVGFYGVSVVVSANVLDGSGDAIAAGDSVVGTKVDMRDLKTTGYVIIEGQRSETIAKKIAATFKGGSVGVDIGVAQSIMKPSANVHVDASGENVAAFRVNDVVVTKNNFIGLGLDFPHSKLTVKSPDNNQGISVKSTLPFHVNAGVGVGISNVAADTIQVVGSTSADTAEFTGLVSTLLNAGEGALVVEADGDVGFGTSTPLAQFHQRKDIKEVLDAAYFQQSLVYKIGVDNLTKTLLGAEIVVTGDINNKLGEGHTLTAASIKMPVELEPNATVYGVFDTIAPSDNNHVAYFLGGNVGVGSTDPLRTLDVEGVISANSFVYVGSESSLTVEVATVNRLVVLTGSDMPNSTYVFSGNGALRVDDLRFIEQTTSVNFMQQIGAQSQLSMEDLIADAGSIESTVNVGLVLGADKTASLNVAGVAIISGNVVLSGDKNVLVSTINVGTTLNLKSPLVTMDGFFIQATGNYVYAKDRFFMTPRSIEAGVMLNNFVNEGLVSLLPSTNGSLYVMASDKNDFVAIETVGTVAASGYNKMAFHSTANNGVVTSLVDVGYVGSVLIPTVSIGDASAELNWTTNQSRFLIDGVVAKLDKINGFSANDVQLDFDRRVNSVGNLAVYGINVTTNGKLGRDSSDKDDVAFGLRVDMTDLKALSTTEEAIENESRLEGFKYAGIFKGGVVMSGGTLDDVSHTPDSALFVTPNRYSLALNVIDDFIVSSDGKVSLGVGSDGDGFSSTELVTVKASNGKLVVKDSNENIVLLVTNNVGIGTVLPTSMLTLSGKPGLSSLRVDSSSTDNILYVSDTGKVGLGFQNMTDFSVAAKGHIVIGDVTATLASANTYSSEAPIFSYQSGANTDTLTNKLAMTFQPNADKYLSGIDIKGTSGDVEYVAIYRGEGLEGELIYENKTLTSLISGSWSWSESVLDFIGLKKGVAYTVYVRAKNGTNIKATFGYIADFSNTSYGLNLDTLQPLDGNWLLTMKGREVDGLVSSKKTHHVIEVDTTVGMGVMPLLGSKLSVINHLESGVKDEPYITTQSVGLLAAKGTMASFLGVTQNLSYSFDGNTVLLFDDNQDFKMSAYDKASGTDRSALFVDVSNNNYVGIGTETPDTHLHVLGGANLDVFQVGTASFIVKKNGYIGVGTNVPAVEMEVDGAVKVGSIVNYFSGGTEFTMPDLTLKNETMGVTSNFLVSKNLTSLRGADVVDISITLDSDEQGTDVYGAAFSVMSNNTNNTNKINDTNAYGVYVDLMDLPVKDPAFKNNNGFKSSGAFLSTIGTGVDQKIDVAVGIGTSTPNAPLMVRLIDRRGNPVNSGNIVSFTTTHNTKANLSNMYGSEFTIKADLPSAPYTISTEPSSSVSVKPIVDTFALGVISFNKYDAQGNFVGRVTVTPEQAATIRQRELIKSGNAPLDSKGRLKANWKTEFAKWTSFGLEEGLFIPTENVYSVLLRYHERQLFTLNVADLDLVASNYAEPTLQGYQKNFRYLDPDVNKLGDEVTDKKSVITLATGVRPIMGNNRFVGQVGINISDRYFISEPGLQHQNFNEELVVSGDIQIGVNKPGLPGVEDSIGGEPRIYFSGGFRKGDNELDDSENSDHFSMGRVNRGANSSSLVWYSEDIEAKADNNIDIGRTNHDGTFSPLMTLKVFAHQQTDEYGFVPDGISNPQAPGGYVGIGTQSPSTFLHVSGTINGSTATSNLHNISGNIPAYVAIIQSTSNTKANNSYIVSGAAAIPTHGILALVTTAPEVKDNTNFMSFSKNSTNRAIDLDSLGAVEGIASDLSGLTIGATSGVAYSSPERDYAEYIKKKKSADVLNEGDVVGVYQGEITRSTKGADHIMVISSTPIIVGNWPGNSHINDYGLVAFLGQVPVRVSGVVHKGDFIVASGLEDGTAVAVSPENITASLIDVVIGRSWEASAIVEEKMINTLVGFPFESQAIYDNVGRLKESILSLQNSHKILKTLYVMRLSERQERIDMLKQQIRELK